MKFIVRREAIVEAPTAEAARRLADDNVLDQTETVILRPPYPHADAVPPALRPMLTNARFGDSDNRWRFDIMHTKDEGAFWVTDHRLAIRLTDPCHLPASTETIFTIPRASATEAVTSTQAASMRSRTLPGHADRLLLVNARVIVDRDMWQMAIDLFPLGEWRVPVADDPGAQRRVLNEPAEYLVDGELVAVLMLVAGDADDVALEAAA